MKKADYKIKKITINDLVYLCNGEITTEDCKKFILRHDITKAMEKLRIFMNTLKFKKNGLDYHFLDNDKIEFNFEKPILMRFFNIKNNVIEKFKILG